MINKHRYILCITLFCIGIGFHHFEYNALLITSQSVYCCEETSQRSQIIG